MREKETLYFWYGEDNYYQSMIYGYIIKVKDKYKCHFAMRLLEHTNIKNDLLFDTEEKSLKFGVESLRKCLEQYISGINYSREDYKKTLIEDDKGKKSDRRSK
jgi:hypothetical protein